MLHWCMQSVQAKFSTLTRATAQFKSDNSGIQKHSVKLRKFERDSDFDNMYCMLFQHVELF